VRQRELQAFLPHAATRADRLGRRDLRGRGGHGKRKEQVRVCRPASGRRPPILVSSSRGHRVSSRGLHRVSGQGFGINLTLTLGCPAKRGLNVTILTSAYVYSLWVGHTVLVLNFQVSRETTLTQGTLRRPTADAIGAGLHPGSRAELKELTDNALLAKVRSAPRDSELRAAACEILVERYGKLVRSCVRQYRGSPEPTEDLMQVGYVGLLKAINNYDPEVGDSLSAYAQPCVSGEIKRHFRDKRWQIHVRRSAQELLLELRKANEELTQQLSRQPAEAELAERLGVSEDDMREARQADLVFSAYSLDAPLSDREDPALLADVLGDDDPGVAHTIDMESVNAHWEELPEREQRILVMRFYGNLTQTEIGDRLGISQMHVSRLLARALAHLRSKLVDSSEAADAAPAFTAAQG
jgi:RNA polymerase sigma-B factor